MENKKHTHKDVVVTRREDGELVVTSRQVAEDFEKRHSDVLEAIRKLATENSAIRNMIIASEYENRGKLYPEYLLTKDGFSLLVMGFTGAKALQWKLKYIEAFNKMEQALISNPYKNLSPELQAIFVIDQKTTEIDNRVSTLENTMTIDYGQQEVISRIAKERLVIVLGGKDTPAYRELNRKVFANLWNRYKQVFHVASYKDTAKKDYEEAIKYLENWEPTRDVGYMIAGANGQVQFNN